jgi:hypothetical protein
VLKRPVQETPSSRLQSLTFILRSLWRASELDEHKAKRPAAAFLRLIEDDVERCLQRDATPDCDTYTALVNVLARLQYAPRESILVRTMDVLVERTGAGCASVCPLNSTRAFAAVG